MQNSRTKMNNPTSLLLLGAALLVSIAAVIMCLSGCPGAPLSCAGLPDPQIAVRGYFDLLGQGRYEECDAYLLDFSLAEMAQPSQDGMVASLRDMLEESYSCSLVGESEVEATTARQTVSVTYLDLTRFGEAVKEEANRIAGELSFQGVDVSGQEKAMEIGAQALESMRSGAPSCYVTDEIVLELKYTDKEWKILYNSDLERMIMGSSAGRQ